MKNILIIADGIVAKHFLQRVSETFINTNNYTVITLDKSILPKNHTSNFIFYHFDPTSYIKISNLLKRDYDEIFIIMKNKMDAQGSYRNIRIDLPNTRIIFFNRWDCDLKDENLVDINASELLANRMVDFLPNLPVLAQNVGLGHGEIMEVLVPFGSTFVYRHIGTIEQNQWRIVALYRSGILILPKPSLMIKPNDVLLLVGKPQVLESVFKAIKQELGQFPAPFGENLYLYIDMAKESNECIASCIEQVIYLHKRLKDKKLIIRIVNPSDIRLLERAKEAESDTIECFIDYQRIDPKKCIENDIKDFNIGLIVCGHDIFAVKKMRRLFYDFKKPILQIDRNNLQAIKQVIVALSDEKSMEFISTTVFDVASQLNLDIELLDYDPDGEFDKRKVILDHYENLSSIFSKNMQVSKEKKNLIRALEQQDHFMQVLPFTKKMLQNRFLSLFSTDVEKLYFKLSSNPQLFVPTDG